MKLQATMGDREANLEIRIEGSRVCAALDDQPYELVVHQFAANQFLILDQGKVFHCRVESRRAPGRAFDVTVGSETFSVTLIDPKRLRGSSNETGHGHEVAQIIAPMPGKVVRLLVEVGADVQAGEGVVTVEAMKMQNEMKSPKTGIVVALNVQEGATVNAGDVLAVIE